MPMTLIFMAFQYPLMMKHGLMEEEDDEAADEKA